MNIEISAPKHSSPEPEKKFVTRPTSEHNAPDQHRVFSFSSPNKNNSVKSISVHPDRRGDTLSVLSLHSDVGRLMRSNPDSMQQQPKIDWDDPEISIFDPDRQIKSQTSMTKLVRVETNLELAKLMEENMNEIENNFPAYEKIISNRFRMDYDIAEVMNKYPQGFSPQPGSGNLQPAKLQQEPPSRPKVTAPASPIPARMELVESLGSSFQDSLVNQAELEAPAQEMHLTALDVAAFDEDHHSSRHMQVYHQSEEDRNNFVLSDELQHILRNSNRKLPVLPVLPIGPAQISGAGSGKGTGSTSTNNRTAEECEVGVLEEDTPCTVYEQLALRSARRMPTRWVGASQQLFEDGVPTKAASEPVEVAPRPQPLRLDESV